MNVRLPIYLLCVHAVLLTGADACSVPVFRYALERWERDLYQIIIVKNGPFTAEEVERAQGFQDSTVARDGFLNARVSLADIGVAEMRETLAGLYPDAIDLASDREATVTLLYPAESEDPRVLWHAAFDADAVREVRDAASHGPLLEALLGGASTVFVLLECGDSAADDAAFRQVEESIELLEAVLEIPEGIIDRAGKVTGGRLTAEEARAEDPSNQLRSGIPLHIAFSQIRLKRQDNHAVTRAILLNMGDGLEAETDQPMVFPVFGRGRVLPPMIGEAINHENIESAAQYLCGACSCQMKAQNPGIDSLTAIDWISYLEGSEIVRETEVPALSGFLPEADPGSPEIGVNTPPVAGKAVSKASSHWRNALIAGGLLLGALLVASMRISRRDPGTS